MTEPHTGIVLETVLSKLGQALVAIRNRSHGRVPCMSDEAMRHWRLKHVYQWATCEDEKTSTLCQCGFRGTGETGQQISKLHDDAHAVRS